MAEAGADRIVAYHSSHYRDRGLPSVAGLLPWASANEQTLDILPGVVAGAGRTPVIATVCANDGLLPARRMIDRVAASGAVGVLNAPTVGLLEGTVRSVLESEGLGMRSEIALIAAAHQASLEAWAYVFDPQWVRAAAEAGATGVIVHLGITGYPSTVNLESCLQAADQGIPVLLHGGNLRSGADLQNTVRRMPPALRGRITGGMGASVFELSDDPSRTISEWRIASTLPSQR